MTAAGGGGVEVRIAGPERRGAIDNLFQLYVHDFSEQWSGRPDGELGDDGRFGAYPFMDSYWREEGRVPLLIEADGRLAGFALINRAGHLKRPPDHNMAEFFVARKHRRAGVGLAAAALILTRWPGVWEIAVARRNTAALLFWRKVARACASGSGPEEFDLSGPAWDGPVIRLVTAAPAGPAAGPATGSGQTRAPPHIEGSDPLDPDPERHRR